MPSQGIKADKRIGGNISKARKSKNLTQDELSAQMQTNGIDISRGTLAKIESGIRHVSSEELELIKKLLGMKYDDFFMK